MYNVSGLPLEVQERWTLSSRISPETSARVPKWYANAQTLHFTEEVKRVSLFQKICTTNLASSRRLASFSLEERKKKEKKINKNSERRSITLRQYRKANVVFAYVRRSFVYRVKISFHRGLFQKWVIRDEKAKVRFKVEILDV